MKIPNVEIPKLTPQINPNLFDKYESINRVIIIGNGFDLAHGLKTSYHDFILNYLKDNCIKALEEGIKNSRSQPHKEFYHYKDELLEIIVDVYNDKTQLAQEIFNTSKIKDLVELAGKRSKAFTAM
jgi:hypothetical protein